MAAQKQVKKSVHDTIGKQRKKARKPGSSLDEFFQSYGAFFAIPAIILLGIVIYSNSFRCAFQFDDFNNIVDNVKIRNLSDIRSWWNFYPTRPLGILSFVINYHFNQYDLPYYHLVNLVIHLINSILVWSLVRLIFVTPVMKGHKLLQYRGPVALFTALLFVSHPLATQSVTYIVQRMASQAAMFYLLSLYCFAKGRLASKKGLTVVLLYSATFISGLLALLTKENAFTLPFAILLFEICFFQEKFPRINFRDYRVIIGIVLFAVFACIIPMKVSVNVFNPIPPSLGHTYTVTPLNYLLTQFRVIFTYIRLLLFPVNQMVDYDYPLSAGLFELKTFFSLLFLLAVLAGGAILYKRNRILSFGIFWFFLALSVESSVIPISDVIFEHRTYLPSFGFFLFMSSAIYLLFLPKKIAFATIILLLLILVYSFLAHERNKVWRTEMSLWTDNVKKAPDKSRPYVNLGKAKSRDGDIAGGLKAYDKAILCNPGYPDAWFNRGVSKAILKNYNAALGDYNKAISLDPKYEQAYVNRGTVKATLKDYRGALDDYLQALRIAPGNPTTLINCALTYSNLNDFQSAAGYCTRAISAMPDFTDAYLKRASIYVSMKKTDSALKDLGKAISLEPGNRQTYLQRGLLYYNAGNFPDAGIDFSKVIELKPSADAYFYKGMAFIQLKKYNEAISSFGEAITLNSGYYDAFFEKALAEFKLNDFNAAINDFTSAILLNPKAGYAFSNRGAARFKNHDRSGACLDWKKAAELGIADAVNYLQTFCR